MRLLWAGVVPPEKFSRDTTQTLRPQWKAREWLQQEAGGTFYEQIGMMRSLYFYHVPGISERPSERLQRRDP